GRGVDHPVDHPQDRRLARAGGADEDGGAARGDDEVEPGDRLGVTETFGHRAELDHVAPRSGTGDSAERTGRDWFRLGTWDWTTTASSRSPTSVSEPFLGARGPRRVPERQPFPGERCVPRCLLQPTGSTTSSSSVPDRWGRTSPTVPS